MSRVVVTVMPRAGVLDPQGQAVAGALGHLGFEGVGEAHQLMKDNKHLGKIAILVGATEEGQGRNVEGVGGIHAEVGA